MNSADATALFNANIKIVETLVDGSRSAAHGLLMELERKGIYIRLRASNEKMVWYKLEEGDADKLKGICEFLHYPISDTTIEFPA